MLTTSGYPTPTPPQPPPPTPQPPETLQHLPICDYMSLRTYSLMYIE